MKNLTIAVCLVCLATVGLAGAADITNSPAASPALSTFGPQDCHFIEKSTWRLDPCGYWEFVPGGEIGSRARAWSYEINYADSCNKVDWPVSLKTECAVAQWMIISMNNDGFHWAVRKPGRYVADCTQLSVRSNYSLEVSCDGFDDLRCTSDEAIDSVIEVQYCFSDQADVPPPLGDSSWCTPEVMNETTWLVEDCYDLHYEGDIKHIFCNIDVSPCNGPFEYVDRDWATITYSLVNQQPWIDPLTGMFSGMPAFPFQ